MKGEKILTENVNKNPINVLSFKHPETGQDYYTPECDVIFRNLISKKILLCHRNLLREFLKKKLAK